MRRMVPVAFLLSSLTTFLSIHHAIPQTPEEPASAQLVESPPPALAPSPEQHRSPESTRQEQEDAIVVLGELRGAVRASPRNAESRLNLATWLFRIGDLDAAIEECRVAIRLNPDDPDAHLQLGIMLMAKQDWRAATSVLKEAIRLDPDLTHAYYSLGSVQYTTGNVKAAIQSYRQALELQPNFPDARYRLALLLKLTNREPEAVRLMEEAATGGVPQAQFFLGNAYKSGQGVGKDLVRAIFWWTKAAELKHQPAAEALSKLRRSALSPDQPDRKRKDLLDAFRAYRETLWDEFPDYTGGGKGETLGTTLVKQNRTDSAIPVLLRETYTLSEAAERELAIFYDSGWGQHLPPYDKHILACLETTAADGFPPAKISLARIYGKGIGVPPDPQKAKSVLKGIPKQEVKLVLDELNLP